MNVVLRFAITFIPVLMLLGARLGITIMSILTVSRSTFIYRRVSGGVAPIGRYINVNLSVKDNKKVFLATESLSPLSRTFNSGLPQKQFFRFNSRARNTCSGFV